MEPISIIGAVGAMANIIDVVTRSIKHMSELRDRWKNADLTLLSLASQLTALRGALSKIQAWMETGLDGDPHHQLIMDLDVSIKCCQLLAGKIEALVEDLSHDFDKPREFSSIVKQVFNVKSIDDVQKLLDQQTNALTLLLTACNCETLAEQKGLLEKSKTRKVMGRAQLNSSSLYVNRDSASLVSRITDNLSKISVIFDFDPDIFSSRVYQQVLRASVKSDLKRLQRKRTHHNELETFEGSARGQPKFNIVLLGGRRSGKPQFLATLMGNNYTDEELKHQRFLIRKNMVEHILKLREVLRVYPSRWMDQYDFRETVISRLSAFAPFIEDAEMGQAMLSLWEDALVRATFLFYFSDHPLPDRFPRHFLSNIDRIAHPEYIPTPEDIVLAHSLGFRIGVYKFPGKHGQVIDVNENPTAEQVGNIFSIDDPAPPFPVYFFNLAKHSTKVLEQMVSPFGAMMNSIVSVAPSIVLVFTNVSRFDGKVPITPLDSSAGQKPKGMGRSSLHVRSVLEKIAKVHGLRVYSYCGPPYETGQFIMETMLEESRYPRGEGIGRVTNKEGAPPKEDASSIHITATSAIFTGPAL